MNTFGKLQGIKKLIFDMDGTLVNTALATVPACQEAAVLHGLPPESENEIKRLIGIGGLEFFYKMYPDIEKEIIARFAVDAELLESRYIQSLGKKVLFPGVSEMLDCVRAGNCFTAIASTGSAEHVEISLRSSGIYDMFEIIKCNEPEKTEMVKLIKETDPDAKWLIVGDKNSDFTAGKNNSITTIAARYGFGSEVEFSHFDYGIGKPLELLDLIGLKYCK